MSKEHSGYGFSSHVFVESCVRRGLIAGMRHRSVTASCARPLWPSFVTVAYATVPVSGSHLHRECAQTKLVSHLNAAFSSHHHQLLTPASLRHGDNILSPQSHAVHFRRWGSRLCSLIPITLTRTVLATLSSGLRRQLAPLAPSTTCSRTTIKKQYRLLEEDSRALPEKRLRKLNCRRVLPHVRSRPSRSSLSQPPLPATHAHTFHTLCSQHCALSFEVARTALFGTR